MGVGISRGGGAVHPECDRGSCGGLSDRTHEGQRIGCQHDGQGVLTGSRGERKPGGGRTALRGGCWAWKHRQLMSFPKEDLADPVTATDYKDPDMVGWYEE